MKLSSILLAAALVAGCDKAKTADNNAAKPTTTDQTASGTGTASGEIPAQPAPAMRPLPPEPVAKEPAAPPPSSDEPRAPVAADLAEYTKDITGTGPLVATIETNMGAIHCTLYADKVPMTVANFVGLATGKKAWQDPNTGKTVKGKPFFDGLIFHRVIPDFMIQGGDPLGEGVGGPGYNFDDEFTNDLALDKPGTLAMANAGPGTNGSQFFITEKATPWLTHHHTVFGLCDEVALVKKIARVQTGANDRPVQPVVMKSVTIAHAKK